MVSVTPGPFLKDAAPNANREGARNNNVVGRVGRGVQGEAMTERAGISGQGGGSGSGAEREPPHMKLVDALSGSVRKGSGVCVGEDSGNYQVLAACELCTVLLQDAANCSAVGPG